MTKDFYSIMKARRSCYEISPESNVSDERIAEVIKDAILCAPSAFNSQSGKVILLLKAAHKQLWHLTKGILKDMVSPENWPQTESKMDAFANGYGTVLYFDDAAIVEGLQQKFPLYSNNFPVWAQQSNGILQYMIWTSLHAEGFGASLQHYNPLIDTMVRETWQVPDGWVLTAQMPFGVPAKQPDAKNKLPVEERFIMYS